MQMQLIKNVIVAQMTRLLLFVLVILAAYVLIGRIAMASVQLLDDRISAAITNAIGAKVEVGAVHGSWMYLDPSVTIEGLRIGQEQSSGVQVGKVTVRLNSVASVIERSIVVDEIEVDGFSLGVVQDSEGVWHVEGLPPSDKSLNLEFLLDSIPHIKFLSASGLSIKVNGVREQFVIKNRPTELFTLAADEETRRFSVPLEIESSNSSRQLDELDLIGRFQGDLRSPETVVTQLYLKVPAIEYLDFLPDFEIDAVQLSQSSIKGEFWLSFIDDRVELIGNLAEGSISASSSTKLIPIVDQLNAQFVLKGSSLDHLQLFVSSFAAKVGGQSWSLDGASVVLAGIEADREMGIHLPRLDMADLFATMRMLGQETGLIGASTRQQLEQLDPTGELSEIQLKMNLSSGLSSLKLSAALSDVRINAYEVIPGISSLSGYVSTTLTDGYLDVHNEQPFSLNFAAMFPEAWRFDSAHARFNYHSQDVGTERRLLQISSDLVRVTDGNLSASGRVHLNLPSLRENQTWGVEVGLNAGELGDVGRYMPSVLPQQVQDWINRALVSGRANEGGMVIHGSLYRGEPRDRKVHELFLKASEVEFDYDPKWPKIVDLGATVFVGYNSIYSDNIVGQVIGNELTSASFRVPVHPDGATDSVLVNGRFKADVESGIYLLNNTPIADATRGMAETWQGDGLLTGELNLDVPIGKRAGDAVNVGVQVDLMDARLSMPLFNLEIDGLSGLIEYETATGLRSPGFTGTMFDEPVKGIIDTELIAEQGQINVQVDGTVSARELHQWSNQVLMTQLEGLLGYNVNVHIPVGGDAAPIWVEATSDLVGVHVDMPAPLGKPADDVAIVNYVHTFHSDGDKVDIQVEEDVIAALKTIDGELIGGRLHFGNTPLGVVTFDRFDVTGSLDYVKYEDWERLFESIQGESNVSIESELANQLRAIEIDITDLSAFGVELENVRTYITRKDLAWSVGLRNEMLSGIIDVPDLDSEPLKISLDYLRFLSDELGEGEELTDPLEGQDPASIAALDFKTKELMIGDEHYGMWSFDYRPIESGGQLENLAASVKGLQILEDSVVLWSVDENGKQVSSFNGQVLVPELDQALEQWGYASSIEGENFEFEADVLWAGSPAMVDLLRVDGGVEVQGSKGRFVQAESGTGALKVLGIFDFASLTRRLRFDFSDIIEQGFSFSEVSGNISIREGEIRMIDPIAVKGSSGSFRVGGQVSLVTQEIDSDMIVTLPLSQNLPWYAAYSAIVTGPLVGAGVWVAQKVFEKQIDQFSSAKYKVSGTVEEPVVEFVSIFNDTVRDMSDPAAAEDSTNQTPATVEGPTEVLEGL